MVRLNPKDNSTFTDTLSQDTPIDQTISPIHQAIEVIIEEIVASACKHSKGCPHQDLRRPAAEYLFKIATEENAATAFLKNPPPLECKEMYSLFGMRYTAYFCLLSTVITVLYAEQGWTRSKVFQLALLVALGFVVPFVH